MTIFTVVGPTPYVQLHSSMYCNHKQPPVTPFWAMSHRYTLSGRYTVSGRCIIVTPYLGDVAYVVYLHCISAM